MTLTEKFQSILDRRHLNVTGGYIGNHQLKIVGEPAEVDEARCLLTCMLREEQVIDYPAEDTLPALRIVIFHVPENPSFEKAVAKAKARGLS